MADTAQQPQRRDPPGQPDGPDHWSIALHCHQLKPENTEKGTSKNEEARRRHVDPDARWNNEQMKMPMHEIRRVFALLFH
jgi:hypothetical protein